MPTPSQLPTRRRPRAVVGEVLLALLTLALLASLTPLAGAAAALLPAHSWAARQHGTRGRVAWALAGAGSLGAGGAVAGVAAGLDPAGWAVTGLFAVGALLGGTVVARTALRVGARERREHPPPHEPS